MTTSVEKLTKRIREVFEGEKSRYHSVSYSALSKMLGVSDKSKSLRDACGILEGEGCIYIEDGIVKNPSHYNMITGTLRITKSGDGRLIPSREPKVSVFVDIRNIADALNGDLVLVKISRLGRKGRPYGAVAKVLKRKYESVVGKVLKISDAIYIEPLSDYRMPDIVLSKKDSKKLKAGQLVTVKPLKRKRESFNIVEGELLKIIGDSEDSATDTKIAIERFGFSDEFGTKTLKECDDFTLEIEKEVSRRKDFRSLRTVTVDGEKARDFDDAVSIERRGKDAFRLYVHIADVSFFVKENSSTDKEAWNRGTSIYFPDYWIPMLPMRLSSDLCSLNQGVDKLTISVVMDIDKGGNISKYRIFESLIRSDKRMTYTGFQKVLDGNDKEFLKRYKSYAEDFKDMELLCHILRNKRKKRGSLDFDLPEPEFVLDATGDIVDIIKSERLTSHRIIEEFMIAANETVAEHLFKISSPSIYRVHEAPDKDKIKEFNEFIGGLGIKIKPIGRVSPKSFQRVLNAVQGFETEHLVSTILLRSLKHAVYTTSSRGHFGLASDHYTHFTSPIRRYPDLAVHRILKESLNGTVKGGNGSSSFSNLKKISLHCTEAEKKAEEAEREVLNRKKLEFLKTHSGEVFNGIISGVAEFGLFVEIEGYYVDGLVRMRSLGKDYYIYEEEKHHIRGRRTGKVFRLGDKVKVLVEEVYPERGEMDLFLAEEDRKSVEKSAGKRRKTKGGRKKRKNK